MILNGGVFDMRNILEENDMICGVKVPHQAYRIREFGWGEEEDKIVHTVLAMTLVDEEQVPVMIVEGVNENTVYKLPKELWDFGRKIVRQHVQRSFEIAFYYIEETDSWDAEAIYYL